MRKTSIALSIAAALTAPALVASASTKSGRQENPNVPRHHPSTIRAIHGSTLYDQSGTADFGAQVLHDSNSPSYDSEAADDFVVTDAAGWTVTQFNFQLSFNSTLSVDPVYDIVVYPDDGGSPGDTAACTYSGLPGTLDGSQTSVTVPLSSNCVLAQGTYWISFTPNFHFPPQSSWGMLPGATIGAEGVWRNPGGGYGTACSTTAWSPITSCTGFLTSPIGGGDTNFAFQVIGTVGGGGGGDCGAGDFCLVTTVSTDAPPACGDSDTIDVSVGDSVNYCYTVTNNTGVDLDYHTLADNIDGSIFTLMNQSVPAGGSFQYNRTVTATATETRNSTWTAQDLPPGYVAEPHGGGGITDRIFCDGFDGTACDNGGPVGFVDITGTGTPLGNGDDEAVAVTMPFSFNFYGTTSNQLCVDNNGFVLFNTTSCPTSGLFTNESLPSASLSAPAILPLWDDFDSESGDVYYDTRGTTPNRQFIVEWFNRVHYNGTSNTDGATFEMILNEDGTIQFEYSDVDYTGGSESDDCTGGVCATIGLQNDDTLFNQYSAFEASVTDNSGITWTSTAPQTFVGTDSVTVNVGAPVIEVDPTSISGTAPAGGTSSTNLDINNTGNRDLIWNADEAPPASRPVTDPRQGERHPVVTGPQRQQLRDTHKRNQLAGNPTQASIGVMRMPSANVLPQGTECGPSVPGIIIHDDGTPENGYSGNPAIVSEFAGVDLFTPSSYPSSFTSVCVSFVTNTGATSVDFELVVFDDTGAGGGPGNELGAVAATATVPPGLEAQFNSVDISGLGLSIASGSVYIGVRYNPQVATGVYIASDESPSTPAAGGYVFFDSDGTWSPTGDNFPGYRSLLVRAVEDTTGCASPEDLPWVSLSPTSGTTAPGGSTPMTVSFDATGLSDGDTRSGQICVHSNDPTNRTVAVPVDLTVGGGGNPNIVHQVLNAAVPQTNDGIYVNWLTGATCTTGCSSGYDFNAFGTTNLSFFWSLGVTDVAAQCVSAAGSCVALTAGAVVGSGSAYADGNGANFRVTGTEIIGFKFTNENTSAVNYGYAKISTTGPSGFPATVLEYWYDNSGADITVQ